MSQKEPNWEGMKKLWAEERKVEKRQLDSWVRKKNKLIVGKNCIVCGKPAQTMHHPKPRREYLTYEEYLNEPNLSPVCHHCHMIVIHKQKPFHMLWSKCAYRKKFAYLPEYKQKEKIYSGYCNRCEQKDGCFAIKIGVF